MNMNKKISKIIIIETGIKNNGNWTYIEHFDKHEYIIFIKDEKTLPQHLNIFNIFLI